MGYPWKYTGTACRVDFNERDERRGGFFQEDKKGGLLDQKTHWFVGLLPGFKIEIPDFNRG